MWRDKIAEFFTIALAFVIVMLKHYNIISISWWWICSPLLFIAACYIIFIILLIRKGYRRKEK